MNNKYITEKSKRYNNMNHDDSAALSEIFNDINNGHSYGYDCTYDYYHNKPFDYPYFSECLSISYDEKYIRWCNFGSSANKNTIKNLYWIITEIFKISPVEFKQKYIRNDFSIIH